MTRDQMLEHIEEWVDVAVTQGNLRAGDKYWKPDAVFHGPRGLGEARGVEEIRTTVVAPWLAAFPDFADHREVECVDEATGTVTVAATFTATHLGVLFGIEPTGRPVQARFVDIWRFEDGLLAENWMVTDIGSILEQIGAPATFTLPATLRG